MLLLLPVDRAYVACDNLANVRLRAERSCGWWEQIVVSLHLRFGAGVFCVLVSALLTIGSAGCGVAVADPGSSGSAAHGTDTNQQQSTGAENPKKDGTDTKVEKKDGT